MDKQINNYLMSNSSFNIVNWTITNKVNYKDKSGTKWLKFEASPVPIGSTDPIYGVIKKVNGKWEEIGAGTCCIEQQLTVKVGEKLGFNMAFKRETDKLLNNTDIQKQLTINDNNTTINLKVGDKIRLILNNPGDGGYAFDDPVIDDTRIYQADSGRIYPTEDKPGDFGQNVWIFQALEMTGPTKIKITATRPWDQSSAQTIFEITINITDDMTNGDALLK